MTFIVEESSFRDRDGFVFFNEEQVFRAIQPSYASTWQAVVATGILKEWADKKKLVSFDTDNGLASRFEPGTIVLRVQRIPFISYPAEWTFIQLRKAALLTLDLQLACLEKNLSLKDATALNVQFIGHKPLFIDLLSFEEYAEGKPWVAYGQFCRHFLGPLLLMRYGVPDVSALMGAHLDGIPINVCSALLPFRTKFNLTAATHIHAHSRFEKEHQGDIKVQSQKLKLSKSRLVTMLTHLRETIKGLSVKNAETNWTGYYQDYSYSTEGFEAKKNFVEKTLEEMRPAMCLDLGANTGEFSAIASRHSNYVVACDNDEKVVQLLHKLKTENLLALRVDLNDPTPPKGWMSKERQSFLDRAANADFVLALALIHHLCIGNNVPLTKLAELFTIFKGHVLIEFVPKDDVQVKKLLVTRRDIFEDYTLQNFKLAFAVNFDLVRESPVPGSGRILFLFKRKPT